MKASTQGFKRQLKAKDAKLAAGDKLLATKITELQELTTSAEESKRESQGSSGKSKKVPTKELKALQDALEWLSKEGDED